MQNLIENLLQKGHDVTVLYIKPKNDDAMRITHDGVMITKGILFDHDAPVESEKKSDKIIKRKKKSEVKTRYFLTNDDKARIKEVKDAGGSSSKVALELGVSLGCVNKYWPTI